MLLLMIWCGYKTFFASFVMPQTLVMKEWNTFQNFLEPLWSWDRLRVKVAYKFGDIDLSHISVGTYNFTWWYTPGTYLAAIAAGPTQNFVRYTVLEWRSIYDIDADLATKWFIQAGDYIRYVTDYTTIQQLQKSYVFLQQAWTLQTLEWFLYPDTYFVDDHSPFVMQLVKAQLDTFQQKIWSHYGDSVPLFTQSQWLSWYEIVSLASVVQKEERSKANQPTIVGIFLRRLSMGMRLDADITLCYYYKKSYDLCTPWFIASHIDDNQAYNTRQVKGLPPTPIANIPASTIDAVLHFVASKYLYYLHDNQWQVWWAETLDQHNANKVKYLR